MAKAKGPAKKKVDEAVGKRTAAAPAGPEAVEALTPEKVHELFGITAPYEPPARPLGLNGFITFWDPGVSIRSLVKKHRGLFYLGDFPQRFAADTDSWRWKQIRLAAAEPGQTFAEQQKGLKLGEPPAAREVVTFLVLHFLATGQRLDISRLRCRDQTENGQRVLVGPFGALGLDIANASDEWESPEIGLAEVIVPRRK